jgi:uncharacterized membrane protein YhaH (DUF805 family)
MLDAIRHGLANLFNFAGRDGRQTFWYYVLFLFVVQYGVSLLVTLPMTFTGMADSFRMASHGGSPEEVNAAMAASMSSMLGMTVWVSVISGIAILLLLVASFVRRLHDSGLSGWWLALPAGIHLVNLARMPAQMAQAQAAMIAMQSHPGPEAFVGQFQVQVGWMLLGWGGLAAVIVLGVRKSTPGDNRFGSEPEPG